MLQIHDSDTAVGEVNAFTKLLPPQPRTLVIARFTYASGGVVNIELPHAMKRVSRVFLKAYYISTPSSTAPLQFVFSAPEGGSRGITPGMNTNSNTCPFGSIIIPNFAMTSPLEIASWKNSDGKFKKLGLNIYDNVTGTAITYLDTYLWLEVETATWFGDD